MTRTLIKQCAQPGVGRDTSSDDEGADPRVLAGPKGLSHKHVRDSLLEGRGDIRRRDRLPRCLPRSKPAHDSGLEPGEGEVESVLGIIAGRREPAWEVDRGRIALDGGTVDMGSSGEGEPQEAGDLVEGLTGRVVQRRAERCHVERHVIDAQQ